MPRFPLEVKAVSFTLRFIEERLESVDPRRSGHFGGGPRVVCDQLYADVRVVEVQSRDAWDSAEVPVSFPLPTGDLTTRLRDEHPRYWEIEAKASSRGIDLLATFLVPVYGVQEAAGFR